MGLQWFGFTSDREDTLKEANLSANDKNAGPNMSFILYFVCVCVCVCVCVFVSPLREDGPHRLLFIERLVDDRTEVGTSYYELLSHIVRQQNKWLWCAFFLGTNSSLLFARGLCGYYM